MWEASPREMLEIFREIDTPDNCERIASILNDQLAGFVLCRHQNADYSLIVQFALAPYWCLIYFKEPPPFIIPPTIASAHFYIDPAVPDLLIHVVINDACIVTLTDDTSCLVGTYQRRIDPRWVRSDSIGIRFEPPTGQEIERNLRSNDRSDKT
jgi:hypothetical protein